jgi:N-acetylneuraminic acid mutarotase
MLLMAKNGFTRRSYMIRQLLARYLKSHFLLYFTVSILMFGCLVGRAQTNEWVWMGGSNIGAMNGTWGTIGTTAVGNIPSSRSYAATWTDKQGNLWLFGGTGYDSQGHINVPMNDLWQFDPSSDEWTWMGGSDVGSAPGVYGTQGVASATNVPGGRNGASTWVDSGGNFWLFGGGGYDVNGNFGLLNDVWELNSSTLQWTWVGGADTVGSLATQGGVYGILGQPAPGNIPAPRQQAAAWSDKTGQFWLFGGDGISPSSSGGAYNDLWEYDPASNKWTWMGGNSTACWRLGFHGNACCRQHPLVSNRRKLLG